MQPRQGGANLSNCRRSNVRAAQQGAKQPMGSRSHSIVRSWDIHLYSTHSAQPLERLVNGFGQHFHPEAAHSSYVLALLD
jgi:hypothetical protein